MGSALFTGVTGLQAHQRRLDSVANNIANVNTVGYRSSRVLFQDLFSVTLQGGSAPLGNFGGANPQQVGLGVNIASMDVDHTQGSLMTTGVASDLAIQGTGFFVLSNGATNGYTRDGSFTLNAEGVFIDSATGMKVQGYLANDEGVIPDDATLTDINVPVGAASIVRATTVANMIGNLNSDATNGTTVSRTISVYDSLGTERQVVLNFEKTGNSNEWQWSATYDGNTVSPTPGPNLIEFDPDGTVSSGGTGTITISNTDLGSPPAVPSDPFSFTVNFEEITQLSMGLDASSGDPIPSDATLRNQDGFPRGTLESFTIGSNGEINGVFTNGLTRTIAQVALASFANLGGLSRDGNNMFLETPSSGVAQIGTPSSGGRGTVSGGVLENSNVDLGEEFSNLIITQRGYQANARTITAADTILQETVNLVR